MHSLHYTEYFQFVSIFFFSFFSAAEYTLHTQKIKSSIEGPHIGFGPKQENE